MTKQFIGADVIWIRSVRTTKKKTVAGTNSDKMYSIHP